MDRSLDTIANMLGCYEYMKMPRCILEVIDTISLSDVSMHALMLQTLRKGTVEDLIKQSY